MSDALIAGAVVAPFVIAYLAPVVTAIVQIVRARELAGLARDLWILGIVLFPFLGPIAWFWIGHRTPDAQRVVARLGLRFTL